MSNGFLHGVEVIEVDAGARPIEGVSASVIGLLGTAFEGPILTPALITSRLAAEEIFPSGIGADGGGGTIPAAVAAIFEQATARVVAINLLDPATHRTAVASTAHTFGADDTVTVGQRRLIADTVTVKANTGNTAYTLGDDYTFDAATGVFTRVATGGIAEAATVKIAYSWIDESKVTPAHVTAAAAKLVEAEAVTGAKPRIIIAPGYTERVTRATPQAKPTAAPVTSGLIATAERLRAVIVADGPSTTDADAIAYRKLLSSRRVYVVDPKVNISGGASGTTNAPASARVAGLIVRNDRERGYWSSPSNRPIRGVLGTARTVTFTLGDPNASANLLNAGEVATIIRSPLGGYRLWGNRTVSSDPKWIFLGVVRTADVINESLLRAHLWAIDRNLTKTYVEDVVESVNDFLRRLIAQGAILSGRCWADPALNTAAAREAGRVYFDFEFDPPSPAERITFRSKISSQ